MSTSVMTHLAVCDGVEQLTDVCRRLDVLLPGRERMGGGQGIHTHHAGDLIQNY